MVGAGVGVCTWIIAPIVPHLVGRDFSGVLVALHWLCVIPMLRGIHTVSGSALTATANQRLRFTSQLIVALLNLGLNIWWIPIYGWIGAAWASVASDGTLAVLNSTLLVWMWRRAINSEPASTGDAA
jgi:O-antigen/teichoic acid export membrane protein